MAVTVAEALAQKRASPRGNVRFVFQPAEERFTGAQAMVEAGVLEEPPVEAALGLHLWSALPVGTVGVHAGPMWASADELSIVVKGRGAHGALPHQGVDAIAVAAQVVTALQNIVSREVSPLEAAVLSIGTIQGGSAFNVIADRVAMTGTLRTFTAALRERLVGRIEGVVRGVTSALGAEYDFRCTRATSAVVNDARMCDLVRTAARQVVGEANVVDPGQTMVSDDMACFLERVPGCYFVVGVANPEKGTGQPHHSSRFNIDEDALPIAASVLLGAARAFLGS